jgi:signal transduction histidine kinase
MRLKTKLVLAITGLVFAVAGMLSLLYLSQLLRETIDQTYRTNDLVAHQVLFGTRMALTAGLRNQRVEPNNPADLHRAVVAALRQDESLKALIDSAVTYSLTIYDINIADSAGRAMVSSDPAGADRILPLRPNFNRLKDGSPLQLIRAVVGTPQVYDVVLPLDRNGQPFATVRVGIRTTLLRAVYEPWFIASLTLTGLALLMTLIVAALLANLALEPIEDIGRRLDTLTQAGASGELEAPESEDAVVQVSNKIERIARRMKNVEEVFSALKENLDQILSNLQDGMMLFTRGGRAVLVSKSVERFLELDRNAIIGLGVRDIFDRETALGSLIRDAFDGGLSLVQEEIRTEGGRRLEVSLDFIPDEQGTASRDALGALLVLHDLESVRRIESELELSRRLASIGRLTSGVGHEVKNPINAIVVHLELLRNKMGETGNDAGRHLDVIESEIQRLDRVVQTLVDFSRPVELQLREQDLRGIVSAVLTLTSAELAQHNVIVRSVLPEHPVAANVDADLLKQALINVVLNGGQAMKNGGLLEVRLAEEGRAGVIAIRDQGEGIPEELRQKIFDLYFTTKKGGSGIGLAMTYRILQLHNGSVDVQSELGQGTEFLLRIPLTHNQEGKARGLLPEAAVAEGRTT